MAQFGVYFYSFLLKHRVFFIEPQEDIDEISRKISSAKTDVVVLVIPRKAVLFQSVISVKILQANAEKHGKDIIFVSRDNQGRSFADRLGIYCVTELEHLEEAPLLTNPDRKKVSFSRQPILAVPKEEEKKNLEIDFEKKRKEILELLSRPSKALLFSIVALSAILLLFISVLALPGATISINPQKKVVETTINITLVVENDQNTTDSWRQYILEAIPVESVFEKTIPFETMTKIFTGENASGEVLLRNDSLEEITLRPQTRFQTEEGIIFRTENWIKIPAGAEQVVLLVSDELDSSGDFIGARGNIDLGTKMFIPGLPDSLRGRVSAEATITFTGGMSGYIPKVAEKDLELAKKQITQTILRDARKDSELFVERKNRLEARDLILVPGEEYFDAEVLDIILPEDILGQELDTFSVRSRMRVRMIAFSEKEMLSLLRGALLKSVDQGMELVSVEESGIFPEVLSVSPNKNRIKITVSARGVEAYVIEPRTREGVLFVNRVKDAVLGKSTTEAKSVLENFREVAVVSIDLWPPILGRMPSLPENISVKLME